MRVPKTSQGIVMVDPQLSVRMTMMNSDMAMGFSTGLMGQTMRGSGVIIRQRDRAHSGMQREMSIGESLGMIWQMGMESIRILMEVSIRESLGMMCRRGMERRSGLMELNMWAAIVME